MKPHYKTLEVEEAVSVKDLKSAYRKLSKKYHPDVSKEENAADKFKKIAEAYKVLSDPELRSRYDNGEDVEDGGPTINQKAIDMIATLYSKVLFGLDMFDDRSILTYLENEIESKKGEARKKLGEIKHAVKKIDASRGRIELKTKGDDFMSKMLEGNIMMLKKARVTEVRKLLIIRKAIRTLDEYQEDFKDYDDNFITFKSRFSLGA